MHHTRRTLLLGSLLVTSCGLFKPPPPVITPRSASVTRATAAGLGLRVELTARNVARVDVTVQSIDVRLTLAGRDLGLTHMATATRLPRNTDVPIALDVTASWQDLPGILLATAFNENVPYHLDGTARVTFPVPDDLDPATEYPVVIWQTADGTGFEWRPAEWTQGDDTIVALLDHFSGGFLGRFDVGALARQWGKNLVNYLSGRFGVSQPSCAEEEAARNGTTVASGISEANASNSPKQIGRLGYARVAPDV